LAARPHPWTLTADGLAIDIRLTPRGGRDAIDGVEELADGRCVLKARVRVAPADGEANAALVRLVAAAVGVAPRNVRLVAGDKARVKRLQVEGDGMALSATLRRILDLP
jgi:uncharacterized protein YggU (UPF0235/DUF167 family)